MAITLDGTAGITTPDLTDSSLTSGRVVYAGTSGNLTGSSGLTFDGVTLLQDATGTGGNQANLRVKTDTGGAVSNAYLNINGTDYLRLYATSSESGVRNLQNTPLFFSTNNTEAMRIDTSQNMGIGTSSPQSRLHVSDSVAGGQLLVTNNETNNGAKIGSLATMHHQNAEEPVLAISIEGGASENILQIGGGPGEFNAATVIKFSTAANTTTTGGSERARFDSSGNLFVGTSSNNGRLCVQGATANSSANALYVTSSSGSQMFLVRNDGALRSESTYYITTASAGNLNIDTSGYIARSTSSLKYKNNVQNATHGLAQVMALRSVTYKGKNDGDTVFGGLIAEEVHEAGLTEFVQYAEDGSPDALAYGNMVSLAFKAIQEQQALIESLKARLDAANL